MTDRLYLGIDVGTGSARAGIFDSAGRRVAIASHPLQIYRDDDHVEQSSDDIWRACAEAVRSALAKSGCRADAITGIGFDATCSLVALDAADRPVSVSVTGSDDRNVVMWMDH